MKKTCSKASISTYFQTSLSNTFNKVSQVMCYLLKQSKYLSIPILCEWLNVDVLCLFDSALCNHTDRPTFLNWIGVENVKFQGFFEVVVFTSYLEWIALRN